MRERHGVIIAAMIDEDGNVAWKAICKVRLRLDIVGFPSSRADEGRTDQADRP